MKLYEGIQLQGGAGAQPVRVRVGSTISELSPEPSQKVHNHSPDGFNWGYGGSGPAQLALALLLDVTGDEFLSAYYHQAFKRDYVAGWGDKWSLTDLEIQIWIDQKKAEDARLELEREMQDNG